MDLKEKLELFKEKGWKYNPETGEIFSHTEKLIKGKNSDGYIKCSIYINNKDVSIKGHQLSYYLMTGIVPTIIDHLDGNRSNNIWTNLSNGTLSENQQNRKGAKGYSFDKKNSKFYSEIKINKKKIFLGLFSTTEEAHKAYLNAKEIYHPKKAYLFNGR